MTWPFESSIAELPPHAHCRILTLPKQSTQVVDFTFEGGVAELAIGEANVGDIRLQVRAGVCGEGGPASSASAAAGAGCCWLPAATRIPHQPIHRTSPSLHTQFADSKTGAIKDQGATKPDVILRHLTMQPGRVYSLRQVRAQG